MTRARSSVGVSHARAGPALPVHRQVAHVMGMPTSLALRGRHAADRLAQDAWATALDVLREADRVFSTSRPDSPVCGLGRGEISVEDCPAEVAEVLALAEQVRRESAGAFDIRHSGPEGGRVLDPSGVVKGWAVRRAARALHGLVEADFCLSAGGDMACHVTDPESPPWRIGIEDPRRWDRVVAVVPVRRGAVATSALGRRGNHTVDAGTGTLPTGVASVTVVTDSLAWADIDATAAFAHGPHALSWLSTSPDRCGVIVWADGRAEVYDTKKCAVRDSNPEPAD